MSGKTNTAPAARREPKYAFSVPKGAVAAAKKVREGLRAEVNAAFITAKAVKALHELFGDQGRTNFGVFTQNECGLSYSSAMDYIALLRVADAIPAAKSKDWSKAAFLIVDQVLTNDDERTAKALVRAAKKGSTASEVKVLAEGSKNAKAISPHFNKKRLEKLTETRNTASETRQSNKDKVDKYVAKWTADVERDIHNLLRGAGAKVDTKHQIDWDQLVELARRIYLQGALMASQAEKNLGGRAVDAIINAQRAEDKAEKK